MNENLEPINLKPFPGLYKDVDDNGNVIYRRKPELEPEVEIPDYSSVETVEESPQLKKFALNLVLAASLLGSGYLAYDKHTDSLAEKDTVEQVEKIKTYENLDHFYNNNEVDMYKTFLTLEKDEVQFFDAENKPVGEPVKLQDFVGPKYDANGNLVVENYRYSPGNLDDNGFIKDGIPGEWLNHVRQKLQLKYDRPAVKQLFPNPDLKAAYTRIDEPELRTGIEKGSINNYLDTVNYFANKLVIGSEEYTREQYVENLVEFDDDVPVSLQMELRKILPGLCAQESKFNNGLVSKANARGIFQIKPATWQDYNSNLDEMKSLKAQVKVAGEHFSDLYRWLNNDNFVGKDTLNKLKGKFSSEEDFNKNLMIPLMINSYNTGIGTMTKVVKTYAENKAVSEMPTGDKLFLDIISFAIDSKAVPAYGKEAREYVPRIYAQAEILHNQGLEKSDN